MAYRNPTFYYSVVFLHQLLCWFLAVTPFWYSPKIIYISILATLCVAISYKANKGCLVTHLEQDLSDNESAEVGFNIERAFHGINWGRDHTFKNTCTGKSKYMSNPNSIPIFMVTIIFGLISLYLSFRHAM